MGLMNKITHFVHNESPITSIMYIHSNRQWEKGSDGSLYTQYGQRKYLNNEERQRFLEAAELADPSTKILCMILVYTGCRISEALSLTFSSVQVSEGLISIRSLKKRGKLWIREVPVPHEITKAIYNIHQSQISPDAALFSFARTEAWKRVNAIMQTARIAGPQATSRGLRHGFAVSAILAGVPLNIVQKWLGHSSIATTAIYTNVVGAEERQLMGRVWGA